MRQQFSDTKKKRTMIPFALPRRGSFFGFTKEYTTQNTLTVRWVEVVCFTCCEYFPSLLVASPPQNQFHYLVFVSHNRLIPQFYFRPSPHSVHLCPPPVHPSPHGNKRSTKIGKQAKCQHLRVSTKQESCNWYKKAIPMESEEIRTHAMVHYFSKRGIAAVLHPGRKSNFPGVGATCCCGYDESLRAREIERESGGR